MLAVKMKCEVADMKMVLYFSVLFGLIFYTCLNSFALVQNPTKAQVDQAIKRGIDFAEEHRPPNELYWHFGSTKNFEPYGFLVSELSGLAVMASHYGLRGEEPTEQDIERVLTEDALQVVVTVFGPSSEFAKDSYLLMRQEQAIVKPTRIRFDARAHKAGLDQGMPVYRAKIVAIFPYETLRLESLATLLVFPGSGGEIRFELDLSSIP